MDKEQKELCTIRIVFPTVSDEQSLSIKTKVGEVLKDVVDAQLQFAIMAGNSNGSQIR